MKSPLRFFLLSLCVAALIAGVGQAYTYYVQSRLPKAIAECELESKRQIEEFKARRTTNGGENGPWNEFEYAPLVCNPAELYKGRYEPDYKEPPGAQGALIKAYDDTLMGYGEGAYALAFLCIFIGSLPGIWYFLLRRLSEMATAIRGK